MGHQRFTYIHVPSPSSSSSFTSSRRGRANLTFVFRRKVPPRRPAGSSHRRDNNVGCRRVKGGVAKCLTRCSKLHLIQRPRLAKWHIVRGASINEAPLPCGGGVPLPADKSLYIYIHTQTQLRPTCTRVGIS